jgi:hypothetical protein
MRGAWSITPPTKYFSARKQLGPDPMLLPNRIMFSALIWRISVR